MADADRCLQPQLVADGHEVGGVLVDRAPLPRGRAAARPAADEVERGDAVAVEVDALDERIPRRVVVLEPVHEDEVGAGAGLLDGDLGVADREVHAQIFAAVSTTRPSLAHCSIGGQRVALDGAGEAALRAEAELLHRDVRAPPRSTRAASSSIGLELGTLRW